MRRPRLATAGSGDVLAGHRRRPDGPGAVAAGGGGGSGVAARRMRLPVRPARDSIAEDLIDGLPDCAAALAAATN